MEYMPNYNNPISIRSKTFVLEYSKNLNLEDLIDFLIDNFNVDTERGGWNYLAVTKDLSNGNTHTFVFCSFSYRPYIYTTKTVYRAEGIEATPRVYASDNPCLLRFVLTLSGQIKMENIYTSFDNEFIEQNSLVLSDKKPMGEKQIDRFQNHFNSILSSCDNDEELKTKVVTREDLNRVVQKYYNMINFRNNYQLNNEQRETLNRAHNVMTRMKEKLRDS